jgi:hypothetical protein
MAKHTLQLVAGPMHVTVTESADDVRLEITGAYPVGFERNKVTRFLAPIISRYEDDPRRLSVGGRGCDFVGHVTAVPGLGAVGWTTPAKGAN